MKMIIKCFNKLWLKHKIKSSKYGSSLINIIEGEYFDSQKCLDSLTGMIREISNSVYTVNVGTLNIIDKKLKNEILLSVEYKIDCLNFEKRLIENYIFNSSNYIDKINFYVNDYSKLRYSDISWYLKQLDYFCIIQRALNNV